MGALPGVVDVSFAMFDKTGEKALFQVVPASGPSDAATEELVAALAVTERTALNIDISARMRDALAPYLAVVVGLALLLLAVVFRSILVPIKATLGFVLSLAATLGAVVAVIQWGWLGWLFGIQKTGPILSLLPIIIVGVVFGLAMDYEVSLERRAPRTVRTGQGTTAHTTGQAGDSDATQVRRGRVRQLAIPSTSCWRSRRCPVPRPQPQPRRPGWRHRVPSSRLGA